MNILSWFSLCRTLQKENYVSNVISGMLRHVALVRTDILEEHIASIIKVERTSELGTVLTVTSS
jgi:hypothetical protein